MKSNILQQNSSRHKKPNGITTSQHYIPEFVPLFAFLTVFSNDRTGCDHTIPASAFKASGGKLDYRYQRVFITIGKVISHYSVTRSSLVTASGENPIAVYTLQGNQDCINFKGAAPMESFTLLPLVLTYLTALPSSLADDTVLSSRNSISLTIISNDEDHTLSVSNEAGNNYAHDGCAEGVYLFKEWTSSTGVLFSVLLIYIGLVTITNVVVVYKFITTWNQITVSLREQNRVCTKYANVPSTRRQTCQEALKPFRYDIQECQLSTICPICLFDVQKQDLVVSCDGGCQTTFHKRCLFEWLEFKGKNSCTITDNHKSCPCCRKEMIGNISTDAHTTASANGFISELSTLVGYYPY